MKTAIKHVILCCLSCSAVGFGQDAEVVYVDNGRTSYCRSIFVTNSFASVYVHEASSLEPPKSYLLGATPPAYMFEDLPLVSRFPRAWAVKDKKACIIIPNVVADAMNRITLGTCFVDDITRPGHVSGSFVAKTETGVDHARKLFTTRAKQLFGCESGAFATDKLHDFRNRIIWYGFGCSNYIARLPLPKELVGHSGPVWMPCASSAVYRWMEFRYTGWDSDENDLKVLHSEDFPPDGFTPIGSVRIVGKRLLSDDPTATFPPDADWLIWEQDGDAYRLCQMRGGRWSVYQDAPRPDAPKVIVINNDLDTVYLLYALAIDPADVEGSLQKITTFLQDHNALQPTVETR